MHPNRRTFFRRTGFAAAGLLGATKTVSAAAANADQTRTGHLEATVTHFGRPVTDATVRLDSGPNAVTDQDGTGTLESPPGTYACSVAAKGYATVTREITVRPGAATRLNVSLEREWGPDVGGLEVSATPVGGGETIPCDVSVFGDRRYDVTAPLGSVPDDVTWERGFEVSEGWWEVLVTNADGFGDGYAEVYVEPNEAAFAWVELSKGDDEIPDRARVDGTVTDAAGEPVDAATVFVNDVSRTSTEDGAFDLELAHGTHRITTRADGYESAEGDVLVKFGRTTELDVTLESR